MIEILQIAALKDNYNFILHDEETQQTIAFDPSVAEQVVPILNEYKWQLDYLLNTHHHWDHADANPDMKAETGCTILGFEGDKHRIPAIDETMRDGQVLSLLGTEIHVKHLPGHTTGHIAFYFPKEGWLFSGDVIFCMGCGRLFEGSFEQMYESLQWVASLPEETVIYCSHEYTETNGKFALSVMPDNKNIQARMDEVRRLRKEGRPTVPTTVGYEKQTNPFLLASSLEEFTELRKRRNEF